MVCNLKSTLYGLFFALRVRLMALTNPEVGTFERTLGRR